VGVIKMTNNAYDEIIPCAFSSLMAIEGTDKGVSIKQKERFIKLSHKAIVTSGISFDPYIVNSKSLNAWANGQYIKATSSLLKELNNNEILFVLGHEIGHIKDKNLEARKSYQELSSDAVIGTIKDTERTPINRIGMSILQFGLLGLLGIHFDRSNEYDADEYGARLLRLMNKNEQFAMSALRKLGPCIYARSDFFMSHPSIDKRIDNLQKRNSWHFVNKW